MNLFRILLLTAGWAVLQPSASAQLPASRMLNASFEGEPRDATVPRGWYICKEGTTPDILPGPWGVYLEPADGDTYVGLITRENGTWESIGQRLTETLNPDECYVLSLYLARSNTYMGFNNPIKLRIWGSDKKCERTQLLIETERIENTEWEYHNFQFTPADKINYLIIEAFHQDGFFSYRGNVMIDGVSAIRRCGRS
ncbi:MAG: hypothetical protein R3330_19525 [Saprospiraceae bacterium]|nr:hypothetical protein [Saprospiraceae bacterium]